MLFILYSRHKQALRKTTCCDKWEGGVQFNNCFPQSLWFLATWDSIKELSRLVLLISRLHAQRSLPIWHSWLIKAKRKQWRKVSSLYLLWIQPDVVLPHSILKRQEHKMICLRRQDQEKADMWNKVGDDGLNKTVSHAPAGNLYCFFKLSVESSAYSLFYHSGSSIIYNLLLALSNLVKTIFYKLFWSYNNFLLPRSLCFCCRCFFHLESSP